MNIKNYIFFTEVKTILNEAGEKRVKEATSTGEPTDENGFTLEWYEENNLRPPSELLNFKKPEIDEDGFMTLSKDELTYDFSVTFLDMTNFFRAVEADEFGTILEFNDDLSYWVEEDIFEVYARIQVSQMNRFQRFKESVSYFFGEIRSRVFTRNKN